MLGICTQTLYVRGDARTPFNMGGGGGGGGGGTCMFVNSNCLSVIHSNQSSGRSKEGKLIHSVRDPPPCMYCRISC